MKDPDPLSKPEAAVIPTKNIFIIKSRDENNLKFETFLKNRGWNISTTSDLKKALAIFLTQSVQYIMISVDHPSPKAKRLPGIIAKTIKVPVILFSENTSQSSVKALNSSNHPYILFPPVSGPSIERMINRIEKDLINSRFDAEEAIRVGGSGLESSAGGIHAQKKIGLSDMVHLFEGDGQSEMLSGEEGELIDHMKKKSEPQGSWVPGNPYANGSDSKNDRNDIISTSNGPGEALRSNQIASEARRSAFRSKTTEDTGSVFVMGIEHALSNASVVGSTAGPQVVKVSKCSRVQCFNVKSEEFTGYVIMAFGSKLQEQKDLTQILKSHLAGYLEKNGIHAQLGQQLDIKLNEVSFEDWSMQEATFLRKSIHHDSEIAVSFFPSSHHDAPIELSAEAHMCKISFDEIRGDLPLEFDMYLYFPKNERYILFTAKDDLIGENRHQRLIQGGVTAIHLRRDSEKDLSRYRVQNFLNDLILEYATRVENVS